MSKPPGPEDPTKKYPGVRQQSGEVQQDSDWNQGGRSRRSRPKGRRPGPWLAIAVVGLVVGAIVVVGGWFLVRRWMGLPAFGGLLAGTGPRVMVVLEGPAHGASYTVGSAIPISARAVSEVPLRSLELRVNGEPFAATPIGDGPDPGTNLARGARITASRASPESPPSMAIDGDPETWWGAGDFPPQWIEIDLGGPQSIAGLRLVPSQYPAGETTHRLLGKLTPGGASILLHTFSGPTSDLAPVEHSPPTPWEGLRFLRIETSASPSWVGWREIEVIAGDPFMSPRAEWYWTPETPGEYLLQARAIAVDGAVNVSNLVHVTGIEGANGVSVDVFSAQEGDTLASIAAQTGIPLGSLQAYNDLAPEQPISTGDIIFVPTAPLPTTSDNAGATSDAVALPRFEGGVLIPGKDVEVAYIYVRYADSAWQRIPGNPEEFVPAQQGGVPFQNLLPDAFKPFEFEAWGWSGPGLVYLGYGTSPGAVFDLGVMKLLPVDLTQLGVNVPTANSVTLQMEDRYLEEKVVYWNMTPQQLQLRFRWDTKTEAQQGLWQVLASPSFSSDMLNPPGLIATGKVGAADEFFTIDFSGIVFPPPGTANPVLQPTQPPTSPGAPSSGLAVESLSLGTGEVAFHGPVLPPIGAYYVRILPVTSNQIVGFPSNPVTIRYEPAPEPIQLAAPALPLFDARIVDFVPGVFPDPNKWGCVEIIRKDPNYPMEPFTTYTPGQVVCPEPWSGDNAFTVWDVFDFLVEAWNWVSQAFDDLKSFVVNLALSVLPCGPLEDVCRGVLEAAVNYGLASLGVPPSLPSFDEVVSAGKGHLVDLAVQQAIANSPVACDALCESLLRKTINDGVDALAEEAANMSIQPACGNEKLAHEHGVKPLCILGYIVKPARGSIYETPLAVVEVTRKPGVRLPEWLDPRSRICAIEVSLHGTNAFRGGWVPGPYGSNTGLQVPAQEISGLLFRSDSIPLLEMPDGATQEIAMALNPANGDLRFPWTKELWQYSQTPPRKHYGLTYDWFTLYRGSTAEITASGFFYATAYSPCVESLNTWEEMLP